MNSARRLSSRPDYRGGDVSKPVETAITLDIIVAILPVEFTRELAIFRAIAFAAHTFPEKSHA